MNKKNFKILVLVLLTMIMMYIWYGNIQTLTKEPQQFQETSQELSTLKPTQTPAFTYVEPKLNPFKKSIKTTDQLAKVPQNQSIQIPVVTKLSESFKLKGFISEKNTSSVILVDINGRSQIISINEEILEWQLIQISTTYVIFQNGKRNDTLWLQTIQ